MAEFIIQKRKKYKNGETEDYVHPGNLITKGYVIINYKKRDMEEKKLMDNKISMIIPSDWEKADTDWEEVYFYKSKTEKESLVLKYCEDFHKQPVIDTLQEILGEGDKMKIQKKNNGNGKRRRKNFLSVLGMLQRTDSLCIYLADGKRISAGLFSDTSLPEKSLGAHYPADTGTNEMAGKTKG